MGAITGSWKAKRPASAWKITVDIDIYNVYTISSWTSRSSTWANRFIWDERKLSLNLRKHGISFETACQVFFDPFLRIEDASSGGEHRSAAIGLTEDWTALFVVHMVLEKESMRIISARPTTAQERRTYEDYE